jgi:hypothetical protein
MSFYNAAMHTFLAPAITAVLRFYSYTSPYHGDKAL